MSESIELQVARVVDQEALLKVLSERGIAAEPLEEDGVLAIGFGALYGGDWFRDASAGRFRDRDRD